MRFRQTLTFLILAAGWVFALSAWAQPKTVAPTLRSARADVAASLPRHGGFYQTLKAAGASEAFLNALRAAVAPGLSPAQADVAASLTRHGGGKPPRQDAALKGGATTAKPPEPASAKKPLNQVQVFALRHQGT